MESSWFNPHPAWMGWIALGVVFTVITFVWYRFRKKKANKVRSHWWIPVDGFANVSVPVERYLNADIYVKNEEELVPIPVSKEEAEDIAYELFDVQLSVWVACIAAYKEYSKGEEYFSPRKHTWIVSKVGLSKREMPKGHPYVAWGAPHGIIKLLLLDKEKMYYWFARECHNVFRYVLYGMAHIYKTIDDEDFAITQEIEKWISETYEPSNY